MGKGKTATEFQKISVLNFLRPNVKLLFGEFKGSSGKAKHDETWETVFQFAKSISLPINPEKYNWVSLKKLITGWKKAVETRLRAQKAPGTGTAAQKPFSEIERLIEDMFFADESVTGKVHFKKFLVVHCCFS